MTDESKVVHVNTWKGRPINELTREELLEVVEGCQHEIKRLRADQNRFRESGVAIKCLMAGRHTIEHQEGNK